jgi:hypothetical protein
MILLQKKVEVLNAMLSKTTQTGGSKIKKTMKRKYGKKYRKYRKSRKNRK